MGVAVGGGSVSVAAGWLGGWAGGGMGVSVGVGVGVSVGVGSGVSLGTNSGVGEKVAVTTTVIGAGEKVAVTTKTWAVGVDWLQAPSRGGRTSKISSITAVADQRRREIRIRRCVTFSLLPLGQMRLPASRIARGPVLPPLWR
jgi:hypothetical protein